VRADVLSRRLFLGCCRCVQSVILWIFRCGHCKCLFVSEHNGANVTGWIQLAGFKNKKVAICIDKCTDVKRVKTRRPCYRTEPPSDAGHLYRKLAPNPRETQWVETTLTLSASIGNLSKNHFTSVPVKDWCMSLHGITGPPDQRSRNSGNKFRLATPQSCQISSRSDKKYARYPLCKNLFPGKVGQSSF